MLDHLSLISDAIESLRGELERSDGWGNFSIRHCIIKCHFLHYLPILIFRPPADLWAGAGANAPLPSGIRSFADPKALPRTILKYPFLLTESKILRGERAPKKRDFLVKIIQKVPENAFFGLLFQKIACGTKNFFWSKWGFYSDLGELTKSIWST